MLLLHRLISLCLAVLFLSACHSDVAACADMSVPQQTNALVQSAPRRAAYTLAFQAIALVSKAEEEPYAEDFSDAAFVGNSRTVGLQAYNNVPKADFFAKVALPVNQARTSKIMTLSNGAKGTIPQAIAEGEYRRVYIMFGVNELGWASDLDFKAEYVALINAIKASQPDAEIFVQTMFPVGKTRSDRDPVFNNANVARFNQRIEEAAEETGATLLDTAALFADSQGNLKAEATTDGIHLTAQASRQWLSYLREVS